MTPHLYAIDALPRQSGKPNARTAGIILAKKHQRAIGAACRSVARASEIHVRFANMRMFL